MAGYRHLWHSYIACVSLWHRAPSRNGAGERTGVDVKRSSPLPFSRIPVGKGDYRRSCYGALTVLILQLIGITYGRVSLTGQEAIKLIAGQRGRIDCIRCYGIILVALAFPSSATHSVFNFNSSAHGLSQRLWVPLAALANIVVRATAPFLPAYHLAQIMLHVLAMPATSQWGCIGSVLMGFGLVMMTLSCFSHASALHYK